MKKSRVELIMEWISQPSTWTSIAMLLSIMGIKYTEGLLEGISGAVMAILLLYNLIRKEVNNVAKKI